ncbi:MAG: hypothetical protein C5B59_09505 [Bacteroidetes bacterium]|nr:MAG: hypothetical protein C5B59_09505 [Bacteroidota bacterium]
MKKLTPLLALVCTGLSAYSQKIDASKVPDTVKTLFAKLYPAATGQSWELEKGRYEVEFKQNGTAMALVFKPDGTLTETEMGIKTDELPSKALSYIQEHYRGKQIKEASRITKARGEINYEAEVDGKDVIFDASGKFLKVEKD